MFIYYGNNNLKFIFAKLKLKTKKKLTSNQLHYIINISMYPWEYTACVERKTQRLICHLPVLEKKRQKKHVLIKRQHRVNEGKLFQYTRTTINTPAICCVCSNKTKTIKSGSVSR